VAEHPFAQQFVGRAQELATFERAVANARSGVPSVLLVGGDAGIGKSRLITEAARQAAVDLHLGRCMCLGGDEIALAPLADLLRQLRRSAPDQLTGTAASPLGRWLRPDGDASANAPASALFASALELIGGLAATDALVVGFEDLHWADVATWDLFEFLARNLVDDHVVLVGSYRADQTNGHTEQRRRLAELARLPTAHRIHLVGFDRTEVATCVAALLGEPAPPTVVDQVLARGGGNAFFTEQLVAAHLAGEAIPVVLSDLIAADIAGLDDASRHVLAAIATVGREADHPLLGAIAELDDHEIEAAVRAAVDARILVVDADAYRFRHALIGEVVYDDLLPPQRARLHRRIADALQERSGEVVARADTASELAFHLDRAGDHEGAFAALLDAADAAQAVAPGTALVHLERAFELWDRAGASAADARRSDRMWQAADLASGTIGNERAVDLAEAAFREGPPPQGEAFGHERLGRFLWASGRLEEARAQFEQAASMLTDDDDPAGAPVYAGLAQAALLSDRCAEAESWCARVFDLVEAPDADRPAWVMARRVLGVLRSQLGDPDVGVVLCRESFTEAPNAQTRALASLYLCTVLLDAARHREAINAALDAVAEGHLSGLDHSYGGYLDALAAKGLTTLGRWSEAEALLERHTAYHTLPVGVLQVACTRALLAARRGDSELARTCLEVALAQPVDGWHETVRDAAVAEIHVSLGEWADAATAAEHGWDSTAVTRVLWSARFAMLTAEAAVESALDQIARHESVDAATIVAHLQGRLDAVTAAAAPLPPSVETAARLAHATACLTLLTTPDADAWAEAARRWDDSGDRWQTAVARLHEASAAATAGTASRASEALQEAHQIASELGAAPLLTQVMAVSRRTRLSVEAPTRITLDEPSTERLGLTSRENEVLALVASGRTNRQIGEELFVSAKTASVHVSNILRKLGVTSRVDAAAVAQRLGVA
jgi:DNA-binding CsgD family transcriptional regulator